jgi:uncharacterized protein YycO
MGGDKVRRRKLLAMASIGAALLAIAFATCQGARGCKRRRGAEYEDETASWVAVMRQSGGDGMWLVSRGYHLGDDVIAMASNSPLSHASVLDLTRGEVIEAVGKGVQATPLEPFLRESHRVQLIRPNGWSPDAGKAALARARTAVGKKYDLFGIVGAPSSDHFYCSELAVWSMGFDTDHAGPHQVLHPRRLEELGTLLFDSRERDGEPDAIR